MNTSYNDNYSYNADIISASADANVNDHSRNSALSFNAPEDSYGTGFTSGGVWPDPMTFDKPTERADRYIERKQGSESFFLY